MAEEIKIEELKFEDAMERLRLLVGRMEEGKVPLDAMIADFEQGSRLVTHCRSQLDAMERRIEMLTSTGEWRNFEK